MQVKQGCGLGSWAISCLAGVIVCLGASVQGELTPRSVRVEQFPATNSIPLTDVVLVKVERGVYRGNPGVRFHLRSHATGETPLNWLHWRSTITDKSGKSIKTKGTGPRRFEIEGELGSEGPWNIQLFGSEYVAGDRVRLPEPGEGRRVSVHPRAKEYGVERLYLMGKGAYLITKEGIVSAGLFAEGDEALNVGETDTIRVQAETIAIAMIYDPHKTGISLTARLRERVPRGEGQAFHQIRAVKALEQKTGVGEQLVRIHHFKHPARDMLTTNIVEIEVIARLPQVNFVVDAPGD